MGLVTVTVGGQQLDSGQLVVVGDQRKAPVAGGVVGDLGGVDRVLDVPVGAGELAVARVLARVLMDTLGGDGEGVERRRGW